MRLKGNHPTSFTSVYVFKDKYDTFKGLASNNGMSLQKLVNRCVMLYNTDSDFREKINGTTDLQVSGSSF